MILAAKVGLGALGALLLMRPGAANAHQGASHAVDGSKGLLTVAAPAARAAIPSGAAPRANSGAVSGLFSRGVSQRASVVGAVDGAAVGASVAGVGASGSATSALGSLSFGPGAGSNIASSTLTGKSFGGPIGALIGFGFGVINNLVSTPTAPSETFTLADNTESNTSLGVETISGFGTSQVSTQDLSLAVGVVGVPVAVDNFGSNGSFGAGFGLSQDTSGVADDGTGGLSVGGAGPGVGAGTGDDGTGGVGVSGIGVGDTGASSGDAAAASGDGGSD